MRTEIEQPAIRLRVARQSARQRIAEIGPVRRSRALPSIKTDYVNPRSGRSHMRATFLISAFGDSMGNVVDNDTLESILRKHGLHGISAPPNPGEITSGTQLMLFTADALIRNRLSSNSLEGLVDQFRLAYLRWLRTQKTGDQSGRASSREMQDPALGWLGAVPQLHNLRASEMCVITSLRAGGHGTFESPVNDSSSSAALHRVSPIGLVFTPRESFVRAARCAAITNGHPIAIYSAAVFAHLIADLARGSSLPLAIEAVVSQCATVPAARTVVTQLRKAARLASRHPGHAEVVEDLVSSAGADRVLAAAIYCVLSEPLVERVCWGLALAANQSGPSSATAAVTGALFGSWHGAPAINRRWLSRMELVRTIVQVADDLSDCIAGSFDTLDENDYPH
jgi:ADP-ribosylglycohydrolase